MCEFHHRIDDRYRLLDFEVFDCCKGESVAARAALADQIVRELAADGVVAREDGYCVFCAARADHAHEADCLITRARSLVATTTQPETGKGK